MFIFVNMRKTLSILLLALTILSCTNSKTEKGNNLEIEKLKVENDSLKTMLTENKEQMRLEVNMIVSDAKAAADYYKKVLNAEVLSKTDNDQGMNETMLKLGDVEVRVLDENKDYGMFAPAKAGGQSIGINLFVDDIDAFFNNAVKQGVKVISPIKEFPEIPAKNAVFSDKFNHLWVVNQKY